jgi:hypothetical protein
MLIAAAAGCTAATSNDNDAGSEDAGRTDGGTDAGPVVNLCNTNAECPSGCCATHPGAGNACADTLAACNLGGRAGIGDPCVSDLSCVSDNCAGGTHGWCSRPCTMNTPDCDGQLDGGLNAAGFPNWCGQNTGGLATCFAGCKQETDCSPFTNTSCQAIMTITGKNALLCTQ